MLDVCLADLLEKYHRRSKSETEKNNPRDSKSETPRNLDSASRPRHALEYVVLVAVIESSEFNGHFRTKRYKMYFSSVNDSQGRLSFVIVRFERRLETSASHRNILRNVVDIESVTT